MIVNVIVAAAFIGVLAAKCNFYAKYSGRK